jgi:hypothetical protein
MKVDKNQFVKDYINLIGDLDVKHKSVYWWASFTASKNKFISKLFSDLYLFITEGRMTKKPSGLVAYRDQFRDAIRFIITTWMKIAIARLLFYNRVRKLGKFGDGYYVLRTWAYEKSVDGFFYDPFFGNTLPSYLSRYRKLLVITGFIGGYWKTALKLSLLDEEYPIVAQEYFLKFRDPVHAVITAWLNIPEIKDKISFMGADVTEIVRNEIERDFKTLVPGHLLYYALSQRLAKRINIGTYLTTFENNPYERMQILGIKQAWNLTRVYGYHHLPIADSALNLFISVQEIPIVPTPDKIITIGNITRDILGKQGYNCQIVAGCALRFTEKILQKKSIQIPIRLLVTPEGGLSESVNMVDFVCDALKDKGVVQVIIRSHPELPYKKYKPFLKTDVSKFGNVLLSKSSLKEDIVNSDVLVNRGSSSVLSALKAGMPTIYIEFENDIVSVDPVKGNTALKYTVKNGDDLIEALDKIKSLSVESYESERKRMRSFVDEYLIGVTIDTLGEFL